MKPKKLPKRYVRPSWPGPNRSTPTSGLRTWGAPRSRCRLRVRRRSRRAWLAHLCRSRRASEVRHDEHAKLKSTICQMDAGTGHDADNRAVLFVGVVEFVAGDDGLGFPAGAELAKARFRRPPPVPACSRSGKAASLAIAVWFRLRSRPCEGRAAGPYPDWEFCLV